jgi:hypothetical protein
MLLGLAHALRGISEQKATGLAAVAGGMAEEFLVFGAGMTLVCEVSAVVLLLRTFDRRRVLRSLVSVLSLSFALLMLATFGLWVWLMRAPV